ncbi:MAG: nitroreductase family protein [Oscillospiraceae bacterium]|jgi:nitroreductase
MTFDEIVRTRRSIRQYKEDAVPKEMLLEVLEAGRWAPSGHNLQNWRFAVIEDAETRKGMVDACNGQRMMAQAPVNLVLWSPAERIMNCKRSSPTVDCSIALTMMILKATDMGLGTCWMGDFNEEKVRKLLGLPDGAVVVAVCPLGWPEKVPPPTQRKPLEAVMETRSKV